MLSVAARPPVALGPKDTVTVQLAPGESVTPEQLFDCVKSAIFVPEILTLLIASPAEALVFFSVTVLPELFVPTACEENTRAEVESWAMVPGPVSGTDCGLPPPLSAIVTVAARVPMAVGAKLTEIVQLPAGGRVTFRQVLVILKSAGFAPATLTLVMLSDAEELLLETVTLFVELVVPTT